MASEVTPAEPEINPADLSIWQFAYYQQFFDVNTSMMLSRLLRSLLPTTKVPFFDENSGKPDLYGPFWICTTLIFLLAIAGNFADYLSFASQNDNTAVWQYDFEKVTLAATTFYLSLFVWPLIVYIIFSRSGLQKSLVEIMSLYGYSFTSYIVTLLLCFIPGTIWSWIFISLSGLLSTSFIVLNLRHMVNSSETPATEGESQARFTCLCLVTLIHIGICVATKLYYFAN
jgi:hypothetical protein